MTAFFVISTHLGGAERSLLDLVKELKKQNFKFLVVVPKSSGPLIDELTNHGIQWYSLDLPPWFLGLSRNHRSDLFLKVPRVALYLPWLFRHLTKLIADYKIVRIHSTGLKFHLILGLYSWLKRELKLVIHVRDIVDNRTLKKLLLRIAKNPNVDWIANSKITAQSLQPISSQVIYNGFPPFKISNESPSLKQKLGLNENTPLIGLVAAIARWKGQREFIEMADRLIARGHPCHFVIVGSEIYDTHGDQGELNLLKTKVKERNLDHRIHFLAFQKNIQDVYQSLDILVHSSIDPEPFGRVIVEAMSFGLPVTAANTGGPLEIIEPHKSGLLHQTGDVESMVENVDFFLTHKKETQRIGEEARTRSQSFSLAEHVLQMKSVLDQ